MLSELENNVHLLLDRYRNQQRQIETLERENSFQREELLRTHSELRNLQQRYKQLQTAYAMIGGEEERDKARQQLTYLIREVDEAMKALKS